MMTPSDDVNRRNATKKKAPPANQLRRADETNRSITSLAEAGQIRKKVSRKTEFV